ncbi:Phycocyanobilin lyase subunit alpha [Planctopirus ephydatiae]|uniref:Phycocyanobilin lyase subunit alpha n=2 Tax=Planctopirus ephydatiae TaxID=2528019 RepID=A0A518GSY7_9PLAN|nr:Phycocyanobilin lyase subunit alpha [Planctopirus ephydatiae]
MSEAAPSCPKCNEPLQPGMLRCRACGERLNPATRQPVAAAAGMGSSVGGATNTPVANQALNSESTARPSSAAGPKTGTVLNLNSLLKTGAVPVGSTGPAGSTGPVATGASPLAPGVSEQARAVNVRPAGSSGSSLRLKKPASNSPTQTSPAAATTPATATKTSTPSSTSSTPGSTDTAKVASAASSKLPLPPTSSSSQSGSMRLARPSSSSGRMEAFGNDAIRVSCECGAKFRTKSETAGRKVKCPKCGSAVVVPGGQSETTGPALVEKRKFAELAKEIASLPPLLATENDPSTSVKNSAEMPAVESGTKIESGSKPGQTSSGSTTKRKKLSKSRLAKLLKAIEPKESASSEDAEKRRQAVLELGMAQNEGLWAELEKLKNDSWIVVREAVATALGDLGQPEATPALIEMFDDEVPEVRRNAIASIGKLRDARACRAMIVMALQEPHFRFASLDAITKMGTAATGSLQQILQEKDPGYALEAAVVAGRTRDTKLIEPLLKLLGNSFAIVRGQAAESLGQIGDKKATGPLCKLLEDPEQGVRVAAAGALARLSDPRSVPSLLKGLSQDDADVLERVITALGEIGDAQAASHLLPLIDHLQAEIRGAAAEALGKIGASESASPLTRLLHDTDEAVRLKAIAAFRKFKASIAVTPLLNLLMDPNSQIRLRAVDTLGEIADESAVDNLIHTLHNDGTMEVRQMAAKALGAIGSADGIEPLEQALEDEFPVRCRAITSLGQIGASASLPALLAMLKDSVPEVRYHTTQALADLGNANALKPLEELLSDEHPMVRRGAAKALVKLGDPRGESLLDEKKLASFKKKRSGPKFNFSSLEPTAFIEAIKAAPPAVAIGVIAVPALLLIGFAAMSLGIFSGGKASVVVRGRPATVNFTLDGKSVIVGFNKGVVEVWPVTGGSPSSKSVYGNFASSLFATGTNGTLLSLADKQVSTLSGGKATPVAGLPSASIQAIVSPNGKHAAAIGSDGSITIVDLEKAKPLQAIQLNTKTLTCLGLANGGGEIVGGRKDGSVTIWETQSGKVVSELKLGTIVPAGIGFNPAGDKLVVANLRGGVGIYDIKTRKRLNDLPFEGKTAPIFASASFVGGNDDLVLLTGSSGLTTWKISSNEVKAVSDFGLTGAIGGMAISPTGEHLALMDSDSADVIVVNLPSLEVASILSVQAGR